MAVEGPAGTEIVHDAEDVHGVRDDVGAWVEHFAVFVAASLSDEGGGVGGHLLEGSEEGYYGEVVARSVGFVSFAAEFVRRANLKADLLQ